MAEQILAIGSIDYAIDEVESLKKVIRNVSSIHCINDSLFHLRKAREALDEGLKNPDVWAKENTDAIRVFMIMLPYLLLYKDMGIV